MFFQLKSVAHNLDVKAPLDEHINLQQIVKKIDFDSRNIEEGSLFFCLSGEKTDGHDYIEQAIAKGAIGIVADIKERDKVLKATSNNYHIAIFYVEHVREALAQIADLFYGRPSCQKSLIGVTGTNGKTTVTHLIAQLLSAHQQHKIGLVGTLGSKIFQDGKTTKIFEEGSGRTTPEAPELQAMLAEMVALGCSHCIMEVSSHALLQKRVYACHFKTAVFTNLTQDHLDYHLTMENYFNAKAILFETISAQAQLDHSPEHYAAIINLDSEWAERFTQKLSPKVDLLTYGINSSKAKIRATDIQFSTQGINAKLITPWGKGQLILPLHGLFNLYNALAALTVALTEGITLEDGLKVLSFVKPAPGRFQVVLRPNENLPTCIIDYAHTPDGLENVLKTARQILPPKGKLICVFGCGGDRDATKRPVMGHISAQYADYSVITSDNPRSEEPNQIVADILTGISSLDKVEIELDRHEAIEKAIKQAGSQDIVLIAGKGHENYQIFATETIHFDDAEEVQKVFAKLAT
jgi:UDP-N-acetylmuramoyl-L-alanyl-D-glutamate--2,6-diaminopimelate ligase